MLPPTHLRAEIARTERAVEPVVGTTRTTDDEGAPQVIEFMTSRRGSSEAEQLIRNRSSEARSIFNVHAEMRRASLFSALLPSTPRSDN